MPDAAEVNLDNLILAAHTFGWAVYVGGALTMELVLRHAQQFMRPSQVAVVCQMTGRRYRWWSFFALMLLLVTGIPLAVDYPGGLDPSTLAGKLVAGITLVWLLQLGILGALAFRVHPDMHARGDATLSEEEWQVERRRIGEAIRRMDQLLRIELAGAIVALLIGVALHQQLPIAG